MSRLDKTGPISYPYICGPDTIDSTLLPAAIEVAEIVVTNRSGAAADMGWGYIMPTTHWLAGQWDDSETPAYVEDTTDAQDAGATDFPLFTTTDDDGFVIQCDYPFNVIGIDLGTAEAGGPTYVYSYWNGSAWTTIDQTNQVFNLPDYTSTPPANEYIAFPTPYDWVQLATGDTPVDTHGLTAGKYAVRVVATTAPTTAPVADDLWIATLVDFEPQIADDAALSFMVPENILIPNNASIVPYFGTANAGNLIKVYYRNK